MRSRLRKVTTRALAVVAGVALLVGSQPDASAVTPARFVTGWIPNWSPTAVSEGTRAISGGSASVFGEVSPFGFTARNADTIAISGTESNLSAATAALRAQGLPVVPSITDGTGKLVMAGILSDPTSRGQHVQAITDLVVGRGYDGIDLDYEGFAFADGRSSWTTTKPGWVAFVAELGAALHARGKLLAVTVPPVWDAGTSGYWVYDIPGMLPHVDRLRLMVYDWSVGSPGPVGPLSWQANVISYLHTVVPVNERSKVQIGVNAYGRSWATVISGTCPTNASTGTTAVQMESAAKLAADVGATPVRDVSGELRFTYEVDYSGSASGTVTPPAVTLPAPNTAATSTRPIDPTSLRPALRLNGSATSCRVRRTVYVPDEFTVVQRANAVVAAGFSGIAIWALGYETPSLWEPLSGIDVPRAGGTTPIGSLDSAQISGGDVVVGGWAADPEFDLPIPFQVSVTNPGGSPQMSGPSLARDVRDDPANWPLPSRTHGFTVGVPITAVSGAQVCLHARGFGGDAGSLHQLGCLTLP
ncbi:MAG: hypothetical protein KDB40_16615 [Acidimicrobiales bacterium]|nr:hypothetical protein [Acidimicrobiales bacterium]MCB9392690.1 hypothetical protein [Acidimicrobiaceae bacterium]